MRFRIKEVREEAGITREQLANLSRVPESVLVTFENNTTDLCYSHDISNIAKALNVSIKSLFDDWN